MHAAGEPMQARFYPYDYNGGCVGGGSSANAHPIPAPAPDALLSSAFARSTVLAVAGKDFAIVAGDTRMSTGFNIKSRSVSKIFHMCAHCACTRTSQHPKRCGPSSPLEHVHGP